MKLYNRNIKRSQSFEISDVLDTIKFNLIRRILRNMFVVKHGKVISTFPANSTNNFINVNIDRVRLTRGCFPTSMRKIANYIIVSKDFLDPSLHRIN